MKLLSKIFAVSAIALASMSANAELVQTDWKVAGDSLATLDDESGLEWLDVSETLNRSYNSVAESLDGEYAGWRLPTQNEVVELFAHAFPGYGNNITGYYSSGTRYNELHKFEALFGYAATGNQRRIHSLYEKNGQLVYAGTYSYNYGNNIKLQGTDESVNRDWHLTGTSAAFNTFLVSDGGTTISSINDPSLNINNANAPINNVPLPATAALLGLGLLGFSARRKKNG
jgi:hypothetical protein